MVLSPLHESHIQTVAVYFDLTAPDLDPAKVTEILDISPTQSARCGDERRNAKGQPLQPHDEGWWQINSRDRVESKDVNEHFRYLLKQLLPHCSEILRFAEEGETHFGVFWKSTYLYAGTGPMLARDCIEGVARLKAELGFDIYQVDE